MVRPDRPKETKNIRYFLSPCKKQGENKGKLVRNFGSDPLKCEGKSSKIFHEILLFWAYAKTGCDILSVF